MKITDEDLRSAREEETSKGYSASRQKIRLADRRLELKLLKEYHEEQARKKENG